MKKKIKTHWNLLVTNGKAIIFEWNCYCHLDLKIFGFSINLTVWYCLRYSYWAKSVDREITLGRDRASEREREIERGGGNRNKTISRSVDSMKTLYSKWIVRLSYVRVDLKFMECHYFNKCISFQIKCKIAVVLHVTACNRMM